MSRFTCQEVTATSKVTVTFQWMLTFEHQRHIAFPELAFLRPFALVGPNFLRAS